MVVLHLCCLSRSFLLPHQRKQIADIGLLKLQLQHLSKRGDTYFALERGLESTNYLHIFENVFGLDHNFFSINYNI